MSPTSQMVHHEGQLVAVVTADRAIVTPGLTGRRLAQVQAMCLYAMSAATSEPPRAYSDADALAYAQRAHADRLLRR